MRLTVLAAVTAAALLSITGPANGAPTQAGVSADRPGTFTQTNCVEVSHYRRIDVCLSRTIRHRARGGWVQTSARHWTPDCELFSTPQAFVYSYATYGVRRGGRVVGRTRWERDDFFMDGCSNRDRVNHVVHQRCMLTQVYGNAHLRFAQNRQYRVALMVGLGCPTPPDWAE